MVEFATSFNPEENENPVMPEGTYKAIIADSGKKENSAKAGHYLWLDVQIVEGEWTGKNVRVFLNIWHQSKQAAAISKAELATICKVLGIKEMSDSAQLHDKPMSVVIGQRKNDGKIYEQINEYHPLNAVPEPAAGLPGSKEGAPASAPWG